MNKKLAVLLLRITGAPDQPSKVLRSTRSG